MARTSDILARSHDTGLDRPEVPELARAVGVTEGFASDRTTLGNDVISLVNVQKRFGDRTVLKEINLNLKKGEFIALLGASGSGKTTLLRILSSLEVATTGSLEVAQNRSVVFQEPRLLPFRRVRSNVLLGLSKTDRNRVDVGAALAEVGLADHINAWPKSLSGGEAQRIALARALVRAPDLLLLDEPFAALDALTRIKMQNLVLKLWEQHKPGVLFITHDVEEAIVLADRVLVLKQGELAVDIELKADRPRDRSSAEFRDIRKILLNHLGVSEDYEFSKG
ncbi:ABC transporter ATP-binding protein [Caballeronia sp. dw_19]|uniref:ABC transporter ATP-binding protein n=1 Tax=Caballeronia sp. dw_19 TaxID=2719791 RepID=UPI001BD5A3EE|nr:ABC transporter ATP-binding protein [Caballeronia sp. dw_19]